MINNFDPNISITLQLIRLHRKTVKTPYFIRVIFSWFKKNLTGSCGVFLRFSNKRKETFKPNQTLENLIDNWSGKPKIIYMSGDYEDPIYHPKHDKIHTLSKGFFSNPLMYYQLMFHELGHSTMHPKRMNREVFHTINEDLTQEEMDFIEAEEELLVTYFSIKSCLISNPDIKQLNQIMWFNSNIFSKFVEVICEQNSEYNFKDLEDEADRLIDYMLNQINKDEKTNYNSYESV